MSIANESSDATLSGPSSSSSTSAAANATEKLTNTSPPFLSPSRKRRDSISSITGITSSPQKASISPPVATKDTSDTASIRSVTSVSGSVAGSLRKKALLSKLSPRGAVKKLASALRAGYTPPNPHPAVTASRPSTPPPPHTPTTSESLEVQTVDLGNLLPDDGFFGEGFDAGKDAVMVPSTSTSESMQADGIARRDSSASTASGVLVGMTSRLEDVTAQNGVDKQMIKKLEEEKAALEKEKAALMEEKEQVLSGKETLLKDMTSLEEAKVALVEEKAALEKENAALMGEKATVLEENAALLNKNALLEKGMATLMKEVKDVKAGKEVLQKEKASLSQANAALETKIAAVSQQNLTLLQNLEDYEAQRKSERQVHSSTIASFETKLVDLQRTLQNSDNERESERRNLHATFEVEKSRLKDNVKQMMREREVEKETYRKNSEEKLALAKHNNDLLTKRIAELQPSWGPTIFFLSILIAGWLAGLAQGTRANRT
ncbi:hypothetical protein BKA70DRAFT_1272342 [Coprinopsis sp. MPI-PUGE-AT-0042]|nr:hypothetical protein BKA70DRAFT_1272342 [Coprinopsis sp. MPI-PUGE-AT-0042]